MEENRKNNHFADAEFVDLPMIPLRGLSVFPNMVLHFDIGREKSINALEKAMVNTAQFITCSITRIYGKRSQKATIKTRQEAVMS